MLQKALCKRKIKAGHEFVEQDLKLEQANDGRDALAKAIYSRLFDRLVELINVALKGNMVESDDEKMRIIGIVDIFGFEVFKLNSLEQLCINFANEKLQALFTKAVFARDHRGVTRPTARHQPTRSPDAITDNATLIELFDAAKVELWATLSEEGVVPTRSRTTRASPRSCPSAEGPSAVMLRVKGRSRPAAREALRHIQHSDARSRGKRPRRASASPRALRRRGDVLRPRTGSTRTRTRSTAT